MISIRMFSFCMAFVLLLNSCATSKRTNKLQQVNISNAISHEVNLIIDQETSEVNLPMQAILINIESTSKRFENLIRSAENYNYLVYFFTEATKRYGRFYVVDCLFYRKILSKEDYLELCGQSASNTNYRNFVIGLYPEKFSEGYLNDGTRILAIDSEM